MATLPELLKTLVDDGGSDLHLTTNTPPQIRVHGKLQPLDLPSLGPAETKALAYSVLTDAQKKRFEETLELDFSFGIRGIARFRCNVFNQRGAVAAVYRVIPEQIKALRRARAAAGARDARRAAARPRARHRPDRQRQVDDARGDDRQDQHRAARAHPHDRGSDRVHPPAQGLPRQPARGAQRHAGLRRALRAALREDPDIVLIGELRDLETIESALRIAETGHLTFATLHTNSAAQTINRIIDVFPAHQQGQIRTQLSLVLEGIVCQSLLPRADGKGRVVSLEILVPNPAIRNLIRDDKVHQIYSTMQTGQEKLGMQTMNQSLATLYQKRLITLETAMSASSLKDELEQMIARGAGVVPGAGMNRPGGGTAPARRRFAERG